jgi:catechol 2,3-dioxygenase-like lactoylglutathione lyase family enzyme
MIDHMILTVSDVERSLAFYKAALKPLHIFIDLAGGAM